METTVEQQIVAKEAVVVAKEAEIERLQQQAQQLKDEAGAAETPEGRLVLLQQLPGLQAQIGGLRTEIGGLRTEIGALQSQKLLLMQQQAAGGAAAAATTSAGVSQTGSLLEGTLYADVLLEHGPLQCTASLLVNTGCDIALNLSEYKADQLGLAPDGATVSVEMGQGHSGRLSRRGAVLTTLLLEGEEEDQVKDPRRSKYLEVWADSDTGGSSSSSSSAASSAPASLRPSSPDEVDEAVAATVLKIKLLSPIREGKDSRGYDVILGARGMAALNLGIDCDTMRLYRKQMPSHFRKLVLQQVGPTPTAQS